MPTIITQFIGDKKVKSEGAVIGSFTCHYSLIPVMLVMVTPNVGYTCRHLSIDNGEICMTGILIPIHEFPILDATLVVEESDFVDRLLSSLK